MSKAYDLLMHEYGGYTIERIENELTWEQVFLFLGTISDRYRRQREAVDKEMEEAGAQGKYGYGGGGYGHPGRPIQRNFDIEDVAEGNVPADFGIKVERKAVNIE